MLNFRKKIKKKCGEAFKSKTREQNNGTKHCNSRCENFARWNPRCENSFQGANSLNENFAHLCSRCENFRTVRNSLLAHECHFAHLKVIFAPCESRCKNFAHLNSRCEIYSKVRNSLSKVRILHTSVSHTPVQGAKIFAPCEIPSWHTSAISHTSSHFSHCAKQGAKLGAKLHLSCKILSSRCENFAR